MLVKQKIMAIAAVLMLSCSSVVAANDELQTSGNVSLTSDYRFRGLEQTDGQSAIQGGFDATYKNVYAGIWASNVELGGEGSIEVDYYVGTNFALTEWLTTDVSFTYFDYPEDSDTDRNFDFWEAGASLSAYGATLYYGFSNDFFGDAGTGKYVSVDYTYGVEALGGFDISAHVGYTEVNEEDYFLDGHSDYVDYKLGVAKEVAGLMFAVDYVSTNLKDHSPDDEYGSDTVVFTISKSI